MRKPATAASPVSGRSKMHRRCSNEPGSKCTAFEGLNRHHLSASGRLDWGLSKVMKVNLQETTRNDLLPAPQRLGPATTDPAKRLDHGAPGTAVMPKSTGMFAAARGVCAHRPAGLILATAPGKELGFDYLFHQPAQSTRLQHATAQTRPGQQVRVLAGIC